MSFDHPAKNIKQHTMNIPDKHAQDAETQTFKFQQVGADSLPFSVEPTSVKSGSVKSEIENNRPLFLFVLSALIVFVVGMFTYGYANRDLLRSSESSTPSPETSVHSAKVEQEQEWPLAGVEGTLYFVRDGHVATDIPVEITTNQDTFTELETAIAAKDKYGYVELSNAGKMFVVQSGTKVKYLEGDGWKGAVRVRILNGLHVGDAGWTERTAFHKTKP